MRLSRSALLRQLLVMVQLVEEIKAISEESLKEFDACVRQNAF